MWGSGYWPSCVPEMLLTIPKEFLHGISSAVVVMLLIVFFGLWMKVNRCRYFVRLCLALWTLSKCLQQRPGNAMLLCGAFGQMTEDDCKWFLLKIHSDLLASGISVISAMIVVRRFWILPLNVVKRAEYLENPLKKMTGYVPPLYPNGWIPILESRDLLAETVKSVTALGQELCVFRGSSGQVSVLDAYCPHLGANLAVGGRVVGDCIECPFHGWTFDGKDGHCTRIPYSDKVPVNARSNTWLTCELNGFVYVWHHAENELPSWEMPAFKSLQENNVAYKARFETSISCHIQEIVENSVDLGHFICLHGKLSFNPASPLAGSEHLRLKALQWRPDDQQHFLAKTTARTEYRLFGLKLPLTEVDAEFSMVGPATVFQEIRNFLGRVWLIHSLIPEGPFQIRQIVNIYTDRIFGLTPMNLFMMVFDEMISRDILIWNYKTFVSNPILVKEDKPIQRFRRWYSQFYSPNSPTVEMLKRKNLEW